MADTSRRLPGTLSAWWMLERAAVRSQAQYRSNLLVGFVGGITYQGIQVVFVALLLHSFGVIGGWGFREIGLLAGMRLASHALNVVPFGALIQTSELVRSGEFDLLLLKPVNQFVQIITRRFNIMTVGDALLGFTALVGFALLAPVEWTWWRVCYLALAVIGGALVEVAIQVVIASVTFRATVVTSLHYLADTVVTTFGVYPLSIFGTPGLLALCFAFPLGFIAYLPAAALLGRAGETPLPDAVVWLSPAGGWLLLPLALLLFARLSRHYQSPGA
ncbi:MAG: ABC-2 family transporter protein [Arachnia sp.]